MPGSVQDLTKKLIKAIDSEGNVLDMETVVEVVTVLESSRVTGEDLKVSRMGKYVNMIRRKLDDRKLSKRMKNLVKQWQKLLQSPTPNGLGNLPRPSHSPSPHPSLPAPPLVEAITPRPEQPPQHPKPTINRLKMQHMLSKVKAVPQQTQLPTQPVNTAQQTQLAAAAQVPQQTQLPTQPVNTSQPTQLAAAAQVQQQQTQLPTQPVTTAQQTQLAAQVQQQQTQILTQPVTTAQQTQLAAQVQQQQTQQPVTIAQQTQLAAQVQQQTQLLTQPVATAQQTQLAPQVQQQQTQLPTQPVTTAQQTQLAQVQQQQTQIPTQPVNTAQPTQLAAHPLPNYHSHNATSEYNTPACSMSIINNSNGGKGALSPVTLHLPHRTDNLVVKFPRHLVKITSVRAGGPIPSHAEDLDSEAPLSLIVSIDKSLLWQQPPIIHSSNGSNVISETDNSIGHSPLDPLQSTVIAELDSLAENTPLEPKRMPLESVPGVHGCLGPDGLWYEWTEPIPGSGTSVTVLPYVYIDGWESVDVL